ncbi:50S ribosomal protein L24 [Pontiella desulfatans]|uniref:Large ribosomal subunit protein uL24 n=1 Tax=Pontiella desulfatans TaxID=2750659 RepID=A0A6C2U778_PONDE|nr:50S ribosomal protein L24 [Pontiella desulfatans]VGO15775.1 50S ribosomal protein L24 [Pontiella desulfatans]
MSKAKIKKGDTVTVIAGDEKGKSGKVLQVLPENGRILIEGINFVKKHMQKSEDNPQGGVVEREAPIAISNVKVSA